MSEKDNPAERLYNLLTKASAMEGGRVSRVLSEVLGIEIDSHDEFCSAVIEFWRLFDDVIDRLSLVEDIDEEIFIKPIHRLRGAVPLMHLNGPWDSYKSAISDVDMRSLKHAIHELRRQPFPPKIEEDVLDKLEEDVAGLYDRIDEAEATDVPEELRTVILEGLWEILSAIRQHNARGATPLHRALLVNIGSLVVNSALFEQYKQAEAVSQYKSVVKKVWQVVPHAADVAGLIGAGYQVVKALLSNGQ
ncbi:MAG TPA: hypothetical protein VJ866_01960 [Pyrinomonadaceae bacterium]|nr:hypothetical protein [Pyrinomonadaceae bacterium]